MLGCKEGGGRGSTGSPGRLLTTLPSPCSPGLHAGGRPGPPPAPAPLRPEPVGCPPWLLLHAREALPETRAAPDGEGGAGEGHVPQRGSQQPPPRSRVRDWGVLYPLETHRSSGGTVHSSQHAVKERWRPEKSEGCETLGSAQLWGTWVYELGANSAPLWDIRVKRETPTVDPRDGGRLTPPQRYL